MTNHPIEDSEEFKNLLRNCEEINYTSHFANLRLPRRPNITKELIEEHLGKQQHLLEFQYSQDKHRRPKYECLFDKSSKYYLKIVLSFENRQTIYIVTAHVINKKKSKELEQIL